MKNISAMPNNRSFLTPFLVDEAARDAVDWVGTIQDAIADGNVAIGEVAEAIPRCRPRIWAAFTQKRIMLRLLILMQQYATLPKMRFALEARATHPQIFKLPGTEILASNTTEMQFIALPNRRALCVVLKTPATKAKSDSFQAIS